MFSSDKLRKLDDLAAKLAGSKIFWGSKWSKTPSDTDENPSVKNEMITLEQAVAGKVMDLAAGKYYLVQKKLRQVWPEAGEVIRLYHDIYHGSGLRLKPEDAGADLSAIAAAVPHGITYLDIETCGFCGNMVFLVGWAYFDEDHDLIVEQALARDYAEEAGILMASAERLARTTALVTYNGKRFDMPFLMDRSVIHRVSLPAVPLHVDLLDQTRQRWKKGLPNCQLQTVELYMCRRTRRGDIPGSDIPQAYHDFVKTLNARKLKQIIHHNFLDLVTLAEVTLRMLSGHMPE